MRGSLAERLMSRVETAPGGCWIWTGSTRGGYGQIWTGVDAAGRRRNLAAHRVSYELARGAIPDGLDLDHLCRVLRCVNPDHLEPVTRRENILRGEAPAALNARKRLCIKGHLFTDATWPNGSRRCLICDPRMDMAARPCEHCGSDVEQSSTRGRPRKFCGDQCRWDFWNARQRSA